ncbi:peptide chain release factor N(5)-glutamine methyltransferase [[Mycoplasma] gypis]|uniref:peptide chain release factor N(5)-glutamine methyltransferase n=1 Tax=[Mycoplasma] gypis TaxID=92404 RepID=A0ABZ2RPR4_9BACT|nr:peptide chain release factor N(5)-glutamine methyltransferase [[Mycoplasma] gypis]MBN0919207.1 peptide chain release factor N(5)-glutamine methyltransferase [[Mycoplasma] gypis]
MIPKEELLREKFRNGLPMNINKKEQKLLNKDYPVQRIIGFCVMQDVKVFLNKFTLIPRYETEEVVLKSYEFLNKDSEVLDLGTGSGFIGLAIKKNINCFVDCSDKSFFALHQAKKNAKYNHLKINFIRSNWLKKISKQYDLIISNPPYLDKNTIAKENRPKYDPYFSLYAKNKGLSDYQKILKNITKNLKPEGKVIFEIDPFISKWFKQNYPDSLIFQDINGKERICVLTKNQIEQKNSI